MGIGHVAVGLGLKSADRNINAGWLIFAASLPDFLLGWFVLAGWESYEVPASYASDHYLLFTFPWSHGLVGHFVWAALAGWLALAVTRRRSAAVAVAIAVVSHFLLDGIVHVKGLPLVTGSPVFGLGLWRHLPVALSLELAMTAGGLWVYMMLRRRTGMAIYISALAIFLVVGQVNATDAPPRVGLIASWIVAPLVMAGVALWLDREKPSHLTRRIN